MSDFGKDINVPNKDIVYRQDAIEAVKIGALSAATIYGRTDEGSTALYETVRAIKALPPAKPEITDEQAIEHLQESGWMQNHDKQMYEMGLRKQLADDSDSYDALLPSAQPEPQWIPCSERLPRYGESVLTWDGVAYCVEKRIPCIRDEHGEPIYSDWWVSDDYDELDSEYYPNLRDGACIAWMPLPEPYWEEEQDEEGRSH